MKWRSRTIGDLVALQRGHDLTDAERKEGTVPVIGSGGPNGFHEVARAPGPGVTIGRSGSIGRVTFVEQDFCPHNTCIYVTDFKGNDPRFVAYLLSTLDLGQLNSGAAVPSLNRNFVYGVCVAYPDPPVQRRIAETLAAYDDLVENNRRRMALLEEAARLLYREWFVRLRFPGHEHTRIVDGVPEGWERGCVSDFYSTSAGGTPSRTNPDFFTGDILWVKTQELLNGFVTDTEEKITEEALNKSAAKLFPERTVLVAMYGATIGELGIIARPAASNQACCAIIPRDARASFIHAFLFFRENKDKLVGLSMGAAQNNINQQIIRSYPMLMPAQRPMELFNETLKPAFDQWLNLQLQIPKLRAARDFLLPRLMSGEIAV